MTANEKRNLLVQKALTRKGKNQYSQEYNKRTKIESGYGDCSGTVWYWYNKLFNINIGANTEAQINSKIGKRVNLTITNGIPDESKMRKGDLLYFRGTDNSRTEGVGHVEMYIGNGQIFGHGSGWGGTVKNMNTYCKQRQSQKSTSRLKNKGLICVIRFIEDDPKIEKPDIKKVEIKELTEINDIVWELAHRSIVSDNDLWVSKLRDDVNSYWLSRKAIHYIRKKESDSVLRKNAVSDLTEINDIVWELAHRSIITNSDLWLNKLKEDTNSYWLSKKIVHFMRMNNI